jgi:hypothetical protein
MDPFLYIFANDKLLRIVRFAIANELDCMWPRPPLLESPITLLTLMLHRLLARPKKKTQHLLRTLLYSAACWQSFSFFISEWAAASFPSLSLLSRAMKATKPKVL